MFFELFADTGVERGPELEGSLTRVVPPFTPSTLNPQSSTLNHQPSTINPQPSNLKPQTSTLNVNPGPSTINPTSLSPQAKAVFDNLLTPAFPPLPG